MVEDPSVLCDLRDFAEGRTLLLPPCLDLIINLEVKKGCLSMSVILPHHYPAVQPNIFVRSQTLSRDAQHRLNQELLGYLKTLQKGDLCIGPAVTWLQEKGETFFDHSEELPKTDAHSLETKDTKFARLWIYSHHIYSKVKRKDILDLSKEFDLTGFCLPGKPGIICVEGLSCNTEDWWHKVRSWNWQKILCKKREEKEMTAEEDVSKCRRFSTFEELGSDNNIRVKSSGFHVDMGDVFRYLENHESGYVFKEYFGISGRPT
nr:RWD domain-containing protein 2A-like isoform X2 [Procambarus clarkii]